MSTFTVSATLMHPEHRERSVVLDFLVDTGASYTLLPAEVVARLQLRILEERPAELAGGERIVCGVGEARIRLGERDLTTVFVAGPPRCQPLLGAVTLEQFGLAADPLHQRLFPVPARL